MKILVDTNILFSAMLFDNSRVARVLFHINEEHETYITDQNIYELREIIRRKAPDKMQSLDLERPLCLSVASFCELEGLSE